ncbi:cbb3-type cytochrome c oxidase subunit 3 [Tateyamaria sp. syn59]|uniref:cbb3-type cytochrome oxidase subunit 3 n=1 Tax=Tateyamaria sp. syn59 TaxID=2576942 RepID=UPI0011BF1DA7|nr:cbb3-type cytochrome c oxidase subunit 3 [Tateyamaria sp. syn59]
METTYAILREFAGSWALIAMMLFYISACLYAVRPSARKANEDAAHIPFRNDIDAPVMAQEPEAKQDG